MSKVTITQDTPPIASDGDPHGRVYAAGEQVTGYVAEVALRNKWGVRTVVQPPEQKVLEAAPEAAAPVPSPPAASPAGEPVTTAANPPPADSPAAEPAATSSNALPLAGAKKGKAKG